MPHNTTVDRRNMRNRRRRVARGTALPAAGLPSVPVTSTQTRPILHLPSPLDFGGVVPNVGANPFREALKRRAVRGQHITRPVGGI